MKIPYNTLEQDRQTFTPQTYNVHTIVACRPSKGARGHPNMSETLLVVTYANGRLVSQILQLGITLGSTRIL